MKQSTGITLHEKYGILKPLGDDWKDKPFGDIYHAAQDFAGHYGIDIQFGIPPSQYPDLRVPSPEELETDTAKYDLHQIIDELDEIPEELVSQDGLKHLVMFAGNHPTAFALTGGAHDTIAMNITKDWGPGTFKHELIHEDDTMTCGSPEAASNDPAFQSLNGAIAYNNADATANPATENVTTLQQVDQKLAVAIYGQKLPLGRSQECLAKEAYVHERRKVVMFSPYGRKNVVEDKAETGKNLLGRESLRDILNPQSPQLRAKALYMLARLYHRAPNIVRFMAYQSLGIVETKSDLEGCDAVLSQPWQNFII